MTRECSPNAQCVLGNETLAIPDMCITNTQCVSDDQCSFNSTCVVDETLGYGFCTYLSAPQCGTTNPCPEPYVCGMCRPLFSSLV